MSKGLGKVQKSVLRHFRRRPDGAVALPILCSCVGLPVEDKRGGPTGKCGGTHSAKVSLMRAIKGLAEAGYPISWQVADKWQGAPVIVFRSDSAEAVAEAKEMCDRTRRFKPFKRPKKASESAREKSPLQAACFSWR